VGESYAGRFIPYILKNYFAMPAENRTITVGKIGCSNPALSYLGVLTPSLEEL
jgi:carboxypeptidase D